MGNEQPLELGLTSVSPSGWCKVAEIEEELYGLEKEIFEMYRHKLPFRLVVCYRCLNEDEWFESLIKYYKKDNTLVLDVSIQEKVLRPFIDCKYYPQTVIEQRFYMGSLLIADLQKAFQTFSGEIPGIKEYGDAFLKDSWGWLKENYWLKDVENADFILNSDQFRNIQNALMLFGKPLQRKVYPGDPVAFPEIYDLLPGEQLKIKMQELLFPVEKNRVVRVWYYLKDKQWHFIKYEE